MSNVELDREKLRGMVLEFNAEELRGVTYKELSRRFNIPEQQASFLKSALNYVPTIIDSNKSIEEMENETKLHRKTMHVYRSALLKIRFEKRKKYSSGEDKVLSAIRGDPSTYKEISEETKIPINVVVDIVSHLRKKDKARSDIIKSDRRDSHSLTSNYIFGDLAGKAIVYIPGEEELVGKKVTEYLPKQITMRVRKTAVPRIKNILPEKAFETAYDFIRKHTVR